MTSLRLVTSNVQLLARVLDCDVNELIDRALEEEFDRSLADPDIKAAFDALSRLAARQQAAEDASADYGMRVTRPEEKADLAHVDRGDGFTHSGDAQTCCDVRGSLPSHGEAAAGYAPASEAAPSTKAAQLSPTERHDIGHAVREKRIARGMSQRVVAAELGISAVALGYVEAGTTKASAKLVGACETWETKSHPCDAQPHVATRRLPKAPATGVAAPQDDEPAKPRTKSVTPEATRRLAASKVREARNTAGLTIASAAAVIGIDELVMLAIESAHQVDAGDLRKACAWAQ